MRELIVEWNDGSSAHSVDQWPFCERLQSSDEAADEGENDKLQSQWNQMQYHVNENVKKVVPEEVRNGTNDSSTA